MKHEFTVRVRFSETDLLGHVNNTSYFVYLEEARSRFFEQLEEERNVGGFILASAKCDFIDQAYFKQKLKVRTSISKVGTKSFQFLHEILDQETEKQIATGEATVVCFNFEKQKSEPIPEVLRDALNSYLNVHESIN